MRVRTMGVVLCAFLFTAAAYFQAGGDTHTWTLLTANTSSIDWIATLPITAAGQTTQFFNLSLTNADHTGGTVNAIGIDAITGDANATENAIDLGSGWDSGIRFDDDLTDYITFENGNGSFTNHTSPGYWTPTNNGDESNGAPGANVVRVKRYYIPYRITVSRIVWNIEVGAVGADCSVGIYNSDGTTLLLDSGPQVCTGSTTQHDIDVTDATIGPGFFIVAFTTDVSLTWETIDSGTNTTFEAALNATTAQNGDATNASVNGQLPATLGTITASAVDQVFVKLQG